MEKALAKPGVLAAGFVLIGSFLFVYWPVITKLVYDWDHDENYSHGFLIVPIALFFVWERRARLVEAVPRPSFLGLVLIIGSLGMFFAGVLGSEMFVTRVSIIGTIAGSILYIFGRNHLKILVLPVLFLFLMVPIPAIIFNQIAFPLQLLASRFGEIALNVAGIPVLREGNVMQLSNTSLEVAEACSGIRSLISLLTLGIIYGYFLESGLWTRFVLALSTIPIAIAANGIRVGGTGILAHYFGPEAAQGFFHMFSGWLIFLVAFVMLFVFHRLLRLFVKSRPADQS
jgi:exosortase